MHEKELEHLKEQFDEIKEMISVLSKPSYEVKKWIKYQKNIKR